MKKLAFIAILSSTIAFQSCGGFKYGDVVKQPCKEIVNPKKYVRGEGQWTQLDPGAASTGAVRQARIALAANLGTKVKEVATSYSKDVQISGNLQLDQKLETMSKTVVDEHVRNSFVACEEVLRLKDKTPSGQIQYRAYAAVQIDKKELLDGIVDAISQQEELMLDFKAEKYRETFEREFDEYTGNN